MQRNELDRYFNDLLTPANFKDYCPNGVQVEGSENINRRAMLPHEIPGLLSP